MSRQFTKIPGSEHTNYITGYDEILGNFLDITDNRYAGTINDKQGEGFVLEYSDFFKISTNLIRIDKQTMTAALTYPPLSYMIFLQPLVDEFINSLDLQESKQLTLFNDSEHDLTKEQMRIEDTQCTKNKRYYFSQARVSRSYVFRSDYNKVVKENKQLLCDMKTLSQSDTVRSVIAKYKIIAKWQKKFREGELFTKK